MRILWFTNIPMPDVTAHLGMANMLRGHWMPQLLWALKERGDVELGVVTAYPGMQTSQFSVSGVQYYVIGQPRFQSIFSFTRAQLRSCADIANSFHPDVIHVHGSERSYGLLGARAMVKVPVLVSIQGLLQPCADEFFGALALRDVWRAESLKEVLTYRGLLWGYTKLRRAVAQEAEILRGASAVAGRTEWDRAWARYLAPQTRYFPIDEMLRPEFGESVWRPD